MKRLASIFMLCAMLVVTGCSETGNIEINQIAKADMPGSQTEASSTPGRPREGLDKEIMENVYSMYGDMRVHFIDVGQGDCSFIELGNGQTMLIDAGNSHNAGEIIKYIKNLQYSDIDYVVATHPHADHIGGMAEVLKAFKIGDMYMPEQTHTSATFENLVDTIADEGISLHRAKTGVNILTSGPITIDVLSPNATGYSNLNNCSVVVKLTYGETVFLFMGDAEHEIEAQLLNSDIDADVLKVGHHGSSSSSSESFIKAVSPEAAVISCGKGNSYGHPTGITLATLNAAGIDIYRTDEVGTVRITADKHKKITVDKKASEIKENAPPADTETKNETVSESPSSNSNSDVIVYRTNTGKKYHRDGCSYLKSKIQTTVAEAQRMGLGPCSRCSPPQ